MYLFGLKIQKDLSGRNRTLDEAKNAPRREPSRRSVEPGLRQAGYRKRTDHPNAVEAPDPAHRRNPESRIDCSRLSPTVSRGRLR
ncbi:MAG: hypothetical protein FWF88_13660 [Peptococcaceae bacterium]|nr:hypothetical protein [Peptococcaceae bacterium]